MSVKHSITLAILCGGAGSRMGGPKGELQVNDQPILEYLLDRLAWPGPTLLVTAPAREHPPGWRRFGAEAVDAVAGQGPLRGLLTAAGAARTEILAVATVDMPGIRSVQLEWFIAQLLADRRRLGVMCSRKTEHRQSEVEPFPLVLRTASRRVLHRRLKSGRLSVRELVEEPGFLAVPAPPDWPPETWTNLNTPQDLSHFQPNP